MKNRAIFTGEHFKLLFTQHGKYCSPIEILAPYLDLPPLKRPWSKSTFSSAMVSDLQGFRCYMSYKVMKQRKLLFNYCIPKIQTIQENAGGISLKRTHRVPQIGQLDIRQSEVCCCWYPYLLMQKKNKERKCLFTIE